MKRVFALICGIVMLVSCGTNGLQTMKISGDFAGLDSVAEGDVFEVKVDDEVLKKVKLDANLAFETEITTQPEQFVSLWMDETKYITIITSGTDVVVDYDVEGDVITVSGSVNHDAYTNFENEIGGNMMARLYTCQSQEEADQIYEEMAAYIETAFLANKDSVIALPILRYMNYYGDAERIPELFAMIDSKFSYLPSYVEMQTYVENTRNTIIGADLVDLCLPQADGTMISVSELCDYGKWVLVDFWATWCGPCRGEIPHLVEAYKEFGPKGLEIYGVSFDRNGNEQKWQEFTKQNGMEWVNVWGTDAEGRWSVGEPYNVNSIPANFLFSPEKKLVAKNLRGEEVKKILAEHIK